MIAQLALVLAAAVVWVYFKWLKVKRYWADRGVPYEEPHPILGSFTFLTKENPGIWMKKLYQRFPKPYVGIWIFWRPALVIQSPEIARRVLVKDSDNFRNRLAGSGSAKSDPIGGLNIFTVNGISVTLVICRITSFLVWSFKETPSIALSIARCATFNWWTSHTDPFWSKMRRRLTPLFTSSKLKSLYALNSSKAKSLTSRIKVDTQENRPVELRNTFTDFTTDLITVSAFGVESNAVSHGVSPTRTIVQELMTYSFFRGVAWACIFFLPEVVSFFNFTLFPESSMKILRKMHNAVIQDRGGYNSISKHNDLMDALRQIKHDADKNGENLSEDALVAQTAVFLQGGFDTSASTLSFTTLELAHNAEAQQRIYEELIAAKQKLGDIEFNGANLAELPYLNACIKETIRKYIPLGWLDRVAENDYKIDDNLTVSAGTSIYVNAIGMHYDPKYFPDPEAYKPERFLDENEKNIVPFSYLPFGEGPRSCIGMRFAQMSLRYVLSNLLLNFDIRPKPGSKKPHQYEIDRRGLLLAPGEPIYVDFIPRK